MKIRELVKRLEKIESSLDKCDDTIHSKVGGDLIDDIIEFDMRAEKEIREEIQDFIDKEIERKVVSEAMNSGSIAQA